MTLPHCKFSASAAYRWMACPASVALAELVEVEETSDYAAEGTRAHELLYALGCGSHPTHVDDPAMLEHVEATLAVVESLCDGSAVIYREGKFLLAEDVGGTADVVLHYPARRFAIVIDLKYGMIPVEASGNPQLALYATAVAESLGASTVHCYIVQPRLPVCDKPKVSRWIMDSVQLENWRAKLLMAVDIANEQPSKCELGWHCGYCPAKAICPALLAQFEAIKEDMRCKKS